MELLKEHDLLLQATFLLDDRAIDAWRGWHPLVDWDGEIDPASYRLFTQLQTNIKHRVGIHHLLNKFTGVARKNWIFNQQIFPQLDALFAELAKTNTLLGVDAALATTLLNTDCRVDQSKPLTFYVRPEQAVTAVSAALKTGWHSDVPLSDHWLTGFLAWEKSFLCHNDKELYLRFEWGNERANEARWAPVNSKAMPNAGLCLLPQVDYLVQICSEFSALPADDQQAEHEQFMLIVNLMLLLNSRPEKVDVYYLESQLALAEVSLPVYEAFKIVHSLIPEQFEPDNHLPIKVIPTIVRKSNYREQKTNGLTKRFSRVWRHYQQDFPQEMRELDRLRAFPGYMMARWELGTPHELPAKMWRSFRHRF